MRSSATLVLVLAACTPPPVVAAPPALDRAAAARDIGKELDDLHDAAARADEARYFSHFAPEAVFLGTDATERWDRPAFQAYTHARFSHGQGWVFHSLRRSVSLSDDGSTAWFDEDLRGDKLGAARGSGVLLRQNGRYLVAQYNLALTVANDRFASVKALLDAPPPPPDLKTRYQRAYADATSAATNGDLAKAQTLLATLVPEAKTHPDDDMEFWLHNELTWILWGQDNITGALDEVEAAKAMLDHCTLPEEKKRALRLHEKWDRSYLLLQKAQAATLTKKALQLAAEASKADYDALAKQANDHDGAAVLDAWFAIGKGDGKAAAAAGRRVDAEKDGDVQDIYVIAMALDLGGDHEGAAMLRGKLCARKPYLMKPLIMRALARDLHGCP